ncbi:hypothetical protein [Snodgrassella sp. W8132]|uniref:hypothetical protein n=1 Tax=Snodgrassella sp. W8132 TaxID=2750994 RepID=UPI0018DD650E|nr:hypothetical protein [Snodgrassella sp. W8132]MBI0133939.1 hypothetical protein [Snodgrassella sp. W8132]
MKKYKVVYALLTESAARFKIIEAKDALQATLLLRVEVAKEYSDYLEILDVQEISD